MVVFYLIAICFSGALVEGSHFRGAWFSWTPDGNGGIIIDYRITWRLTSGGVFCNDSVIAAGTLIGGGSLACITGCSDTIGTLQYRCTDFSPATEKDWSTGIGTLTYTPPSGNTTFTFGFRGGNWISTLYIGADSGWSLIATVDLSVRADTGQINHSPTTDMLPLLVVQRGCNFSIQIPVNDVDGDTVRCRWAVGNDECVNICNAAPIVTLDQNTCTLTYDPVAAATYPAGLYAVAVQIEDFATPASTTPLSSIPLQFLIELYQSPEPCGSGPELIDPTPSSCVLLQVGDVMNISLVARSQNKLLSMTTTSSLGLQRTSPVFTSDGTWNYITVNVMWTPSPSDVGTEKVLCFYATDTAGVASDISCISILVTACVAPPAPANGGFTLTITPSCDYTGKYTCNPGYDVVGTANVVCGASGQWSSPPIFCKPQVDCGPLSAPGNGSIWQPFTSLDAYTVFFCDPGFYLDGEKTPICQADGNWSHIPPTCKLIDCGVFGAPLNGSVVFNSTLLGGTAVVSCDKGFDLHGDKMVTCQKNGWWSSTIHPCFSHKCVIVDCGPPTAPGNGKVNYDRTTYGAVAVYECDDSFELDGQLTTTCLSNGTWSGTVPDCVDDSSDSSKSSDSGKKSGSSSSSGGPKKNKPRGNPGRKGKGR